MYEEVDLSIMILRALLSANAVEVANLNTSLSLSPSLRLSLSDSLSHAL